MGSLDKIPQFVLIKSDVPGEIIVEIRTINNKGLLNYSGLCVQGAPLRNTSFINGQIIMAAGGPQILHDCNRSRRKVFKALTAGVQYYFYVYAANSSSVSPLSDGKSLWAY